MKNKNFANVILGTVILIFASPVMLLADDLPFFLRHNLISYQQIDDDIILDYNLIIENTEDDSIYSLTLTQVPLLFISTDEIILTVGNLPGYGSRELSFQFSTPMLLNEQDFTMQSLFWIGKYQDEVGQGYNLPLESHPVLLPAEGEGGTQ
jgi:hypothetical protein